MDLIFSDLKEDTRWNLTRQRYRAACHSIRRIAHYNSRPQLSEILCDDPIEDRCDGSFRSVFPIRL